MAGTTRPASRVGAWVPFLERFILVTLVALGGTTVVAASWARDLSAPRVTLLGADRGISALVTAGSARILILGGTNSAELGNALSKARHPGLDRIDVLIVSGNAAAADLATRSVRLFQPRMTISVGSDASLRDAEGVPAKVIDHSTEIELPDGVSIAIEVWPSEDGDGDDVTWSAMIERGGSSVYWVSDREALMQDALPSEADVTVIGRGRLAADTPLPRGHAIVAAGESISGPELRAIVRNSADSEIEAARVFAGDIDRIDLDPTGIRSIGGTLAAASPTPE